MDISKLVGQVTGQIGGQVGGQASGQDGSKSGGMDGKSMAAGAALGGMAGLFANSRTARQMKRKAGQAARRHGGMAGLALVGGLAYKAYSDHKVKQAQTAALPDPQVGHAGFITDESQTDLDASLLVLRAMIAAASSDGEIDAEERGAIMAEIKELGISRSNTGKLMAEMGNPATPAQIAADVQTVEQAVQVYTAACLAITVDTSDEEQFLSELGQSLGLSDDLLAQVNETVAAF
jgi:uncharacterized membrane protein YebE (DUF533 family)